MISILSRSKTHFAGVLVVAAMLAAQPASLRAQELPVEEVLKNSRYVSEIPLPKDAAGKWLAFPLTPAIFDGARWDLADLRLLDANNQSVPYAVRAYPARSVSKEVEARTFNRVTAPDGSVELSLDLGETQFDHNQIEVSTSGVNFRRTAILEGSADGENWGKLAEGRLLRFAGVRKVLQEERIEYPTSRFRYLRARVRPDTSGEMEPVEINTVTIRRLIETPGEFVTCEVKLGPREPISHNGVIGSAWTIDLGGSQVPCQRLEFTIEGLEFNRDFDILPLPDKTETPAYWANYDPYAYSYYNANAYRGPEATSSPTGTSLTESFTRFSGMHGVWRRRAGEGDVPLVADLGNVRCGKLRLFVADAANAPLKIESVKSVTPLCLVIFANSPELKPPLKAYYGNSQAPPPNFDFARNLPEKLDPPPTPVAEETERQENSAYVPPPLPFTERWKWLIHCVLGGVSLILAGLVVQLARRAIARHDAAASTTAQAAP